MVQVTKLFVILQVILRHYIYHYGRHLIQVAMVIARDTENFLFCLVSAVPGPDYGLFQVILPAGCYGNSEGLH